MSPDDRYAAERLAGLPFDILTIVICAEVIVFTDALMGLDVPPLRVRAAELILRVACNRFGCGSVDDLLDVLEMPTNVN